MEMSEKIKWMMWFYAGCMARICEEVVYKGHAFRSICNWPVLPYWQPLFVWYLQHWQGVNRQYIRWKIDICRLNTPVGAWHLFAYWTEFICNQASRESNMWLSAGLSRIQTAQGEETIVHTSLVCVCFHFHRDVLRSYSSAP